MEEIEINLKHLAVKYLAISLLTTYQLNVSHHAFTLMFHELSHLIEDHLHHEHHQHHVHNHNHTTDHEHRILFSFEESFENHTAHSPSEDERATIVRLNFDKHLLSFYNLKTLFAKNIHPNCKVVFFKKINNFKEVPTPPPEDNKHILH